VEADVSAAKLDRLRDLLRGLGGVVVAYSGGVDSVFLARVAHEALGERAVAVLGASPSLPSREREAALAVAREIGIELELVETGELDAAAYRANAPDRCFHCKSELFRQCRAVAERRGMPVIVDGFNADDAGDFRPGAKAAEEAGVRHPLAEAGLTKAEIRELSKALKLPTWDKPAMACLASRIPYGVEVTVERLKMIETVENGLKDMGFKQVRARHHGELVRLELAAGELDRLFDPAVRAEVSRLARAAGFRYATADLDGYRMGSLNEGLPRARS